jgi:shikimate kinase
VSPRAVLVGLPGTGKSTVGRRLARILGVPFADTDELVEQATGCTVPELFETRGEDAFRAIEADTIASALERFDGVLALGGGAVTTPRMRATIAASGVPVVRLQAPITVLTARVGDARTRPLLRSGPSERLAELAAEREPAYQDVATMTVGTDQRTPGQVAATIAARLHENAPRT